MDIFTDQDLLKVAEAWREFDAPSGADEFGRRIYGSIRSALNAYRDRLITLRRMEIIPTDLSQKQPLILTFNYGVTYVDHKTN